ncbi:DUF4129 domain-containing protein [Roseibium sp. SCP14]|uniref:DUF4129 domain-containing protein n=1 Tax=Roseibium sp. SCP14 TaxID=3141375 RepID=UPI0033351ED8
MFVFIGFLASLSSSHAQEPVQEPFEVGESGEEYLRSLPWRGIETDVVYFDPSSPPPDLDTKQRPEPAPSGGSGQGQDLNARLTTGLIAGAILALIIYLFLRFGGGIAVSLKRDAVNPGSNRAARQPAAPPWAEKLSTFDEILRTSDRRRALVLLTQKVLATAITANGILMQRSWTAREALQHLPQDQRKLDALRSLVLASERVQFGGRDITEDEFRNHLAHGRQIVGPGVS